MGSSHLLSKIKEAARKMIVRWRTENILRFM
jgi:hypothetical protein